jgi:phage-related protein
MDIVLLPETAAYIAALSDDVEKAQIYSYFERQKSLGFRLKGPVSKTLRGFIHEIRPGPNRFLFFYDRHRIVIVHAFRKKSQRTPEKHIGAAVRKREVYLKWERHENG